jgi:enediyne polyketide synthase
VSPEIAIVGIGCRFPDARSFDELWHNALAGRRAFRTIPERRIRVADYAPRFDGDPDATYVRRAALIEGFELDRARFKISGPTARATDLVHWLALEVADHALRDAGFPDGHGLPRATTGVLVGNSLTGEMSRASALRLRWPYVERVLASVLEREGMGASRCAAVLAAAAVGFKQPLPAANEDTLAGGLSNTIAGRICNTFDLGGGGFTVDGACSSSLLAVAQACSALVAGDLDVAIAGGVDVSLDPFELVGFARLGALAKDAMRIYDRHPTGFLPGEGAGLVVLVRRADAEHRGLRIHAVIRGWGVSSDGRGGITRPKPAGHQVAIDRCYARAQIGIETVALFEGHGTGTEVGDAAELTAIAGVVRAARAQRPAAIGSAIGLAIGPAIGSIKALVGHTKAAAGIAGLLKVVGAVRDRLVPPSFGIDDPHEALAGHDAVLRAPATIEAWPDDGPARAGVSAVGFGGINVHVTVEGTRGVARQGLSAAARRLARTHQDAELLVVSARDPEALAARASRLAARTGAASFAELTDLAAKLAAEDPHGAVRAAIVAATPDEARASLEAIAQAAAGGRDLRDAALGRFLATATRGVRIGLLFTGQAAPVPPDGGALARRFASAAAIWSHVPVPGEIDRADTRNAQPAIVAASLAAVTILEDLGLVGDVAVGHSLGELSALAWAGCWPPAEAVALAAARGEAMVAASPIAGAMAGLGADAGRVRTLIAGTDAVIAAYNGPEQIVISGPRPAIEAVMRRARDGGIAVTPLATSHAFHAPLMAAAATPLRDALRARPPRPPTRPVISTVTGHLYHGELEQMLVDQLTAPVLFTEALQRASPLDLLVEVGPGRVLATLAGALVTAPVIAVDACGRSLRGLLAALGAAWTLGGNIEIRELFADRWCKPVDVETPPSLFANPCEAAPSAAGARAEPPDPPPEPSAASLEPPGVARSPEPGVADLDPPAAARSPAAVLAAVRRCVAETTELAPASIADEARLLEDLHLSSITIAQIVTRAARAIGISAPRPLTGWARATIRDVVAAFCEDARLAPTAPVSATPAASWVRAFATVDEPAPPPAPPRRSNAGWRWHGATPEDPRLAEALRDAGGGTLIVLSGVDDAETIVDALKCDGPFLVLDQARIGGGFARTLHLETGQPVTLASFEALDSAAALASLRAEAAGLGGGFRAVHVQRDGTLTTPVFEAVALGPSPALELGADDVVLVTGGGKGIAAECALALAEASGCRIATIGRHAPDADPALAANLARFAARGVHAMHAAADVTDTRALAAAVQTIVDAMGPITAVVHAAAVNEPRALRDLTAGELRRTIAPKRAGLINLVSAVDRSRLRAIVAFGSVIARTGLAGESHYALANDLLRRAMEELQAELPACRCAVLEWSAWAEVGMAERIGRLDALIQRGLSPISIEDGVRMFLRAVGRAGSLVIAGRLGDAGLAAFRPHKLPLARFIERPILHVPGVELVSEVELSPAVDLYLDDHVLEGARVMPAVLQIEAAHQVVAALTGEARSWHIAAVEFPRAILVEADGTRIRIAACVHDDGRAEVVITAAGDAHTSERMRLWLSPCAPGPDRVQDVVTAGASWPAPYGELLPQRGRFARIRSYHEIATRRCRFIVRTTNEAGPWFAHHMPAAFELADPGVRDALLHGMQVAVPDERLVPVAARGLQLAHHWPQGDVVVEARELAAGDGEYTWSLVVRDSHGRELERWSEVTFRSLGRRQTIPSLVLRPWLERRLGALVPAVQIGAFDERATASGLADLGVHQVRYRPDHRPEADGVGISTSTAGQLRIAVAGPERVACDIELVEARGDDVWRDLLGPNAELAARLVEVTRDPFDHAATRLWTAMECAAKLGCPDPQLLLVSATGDAACVRTGDIEITTLVCEVLGVGWVAVGVATAPCPIAATIGAAS